MELFIEFQAEAIETTRSLVSDMFELDAAKWPSIFVCLEQTRMAEVRSQMRRDRRMNQMCKPH